MEFLILPDHPAAARHAREDGGRQVLSHASGRPWIVGRWDAASLTEVAAGRNRLALLGATHVDPATLRPRLARARTVGDLDPLARALPGSVHLVASIDGRVRAQGSVSTARQVCHATVDGITLAGDRPQALAALTGGGVREEVLALWMLAPFGPPWPLSGQALWDGVGTVPPDAHLVIDPDGTSRTRRWWTAPEPQVPLAEGAEALRAALVDAVAARCGDGAPVSCDLSGGMDSTSLCFLAARHTDELVTVHYEALDPSNNDRRWAQRCRAELPGARHVVVPPGGAPAWYADLAVAEPDPEGPLPFARSRAQTEHLARTVAEHGAVRHLQGIGGDELFHPSALYLHTLVRRHPREAVRLVRASRAMRRWSLARTVRNLAALPDFPRWLAGTAGGLVDPRTDHRDMDWELAPKMPPWATPDAVDAARRLLAEAAEQRPGPLAEPPVHHEMLRLLQVDGAAVRRNSRLAETFGVAFHAPYLDDRVIEAAMAVRLPDRMVPGRQKPVLAAAMRGLVPHVLDRRTKGDASAELYAGLRRHRAELVDLCADSRLARLGLADPGALRAVVEGVHADTRPFMPFDPTLGLELWLRALDREPTPA
ncbi:asparagine synthase-related protein [Spirillospora sp. CA-253888]